MTIDLSPEDQKHAEALVASGRFASIEEAIHAGLQAVDEPEEWKDYARDRIDAGLADIEAGRTKSAEEILAMLDSYSQRKA